MIPIYLHRDLFAANRMVKNPFVIYSPQIVWLKFLL